MTAPDPDTEELLELARRGDARAVDGLLTRHRGRLRQMVALRLDRRLAARIDPSDVVQEALQRAHERLGEYLDEPTVPFYVWLRQIAWQKLVDLYRHHRGRRRDPAREVPLHLPLAEESALDLARQLLAASYSTPSRQFLRKEMEARLRAALDILSPADREVVTLRHLERLRVKEIASTLGLSEAAVQSRYRRAVERLHRLLSDAAEESHD